MRRRAPELPYARSAVWTRRFAGVGAALALAAVLMPRRDGWTASEAVPLLGIALALAALAFPTALVAFTVIWRTGWRGLGRVTTGLVLATATLAYPGYLLAGVVLAVPEWDASTDPNDPPAFAAHTDGGTATVPILAWLLRPNAPADLQPFETDEDPVRTYREALKVVKTLRWRVVAGTAPDAGSSGRIEAVASSAVMRLPEQIAIRVAVQDGQTRVDIRSAFRLFGLPLVGHDNARNVEAFVDAMDDQAAEN
jgi:Protein of unknown function (DUF1499)